MNRRAINHPAVIAVATSEISVKKAMQWPRPVLRATTAHAKMLNGSGQIAELCRNPRPGCRSSVPKSRETCVTQGQYRATGAKRSGDAAH